MIRAFRSLGPSLRRLFRAFEHRAYRLFFLAFVANQMGFWLANLAMQGVMVDLTDNDPSWVGRLFFAMFSPALLLSPIAGVVADRVDRRQMLIVSYVVVAVVSGIMAALAASGALQPLNLMALAFACGVAFSFAGPASSAVAANIVDPADLVSAISLQSSANNLTRVLGPAVAAPLIAGGRYATSFLVFAVASLVAGAFIWAIRVPDYERDSDASGVWERVRGGWDHAGERPPALLALFTASVLSVFGVAHTALIPSFTEEVFGSADAFPWIFASTGVGAFAGAMITGVEGRPRLARSTQRLFLYGIVLTAFSWSQSLAGALVTQALVGFFYFSVMTGIQTLLQEIVDDAKRGRVLSLFFVAWGGIFPLGALALGEIAKAIGVANAISGAASVCLLVGAGLTLYLRRQGA